MGGGGPDALGYEARLGTRDVGQYYAEFFATPAANHVGALEVVLYRYHDRAQDIVADHVAVGVVVLLEAIYIEHDERDVEFVLLGLAQGAVELVDEDAVVVDTRQGVALSLLVDLGVELGVLQRERGLPGYRSEEPQVVLIEGVSSQ